MTARHPCCQACGQLLYPQDRECPNCGARRQDADGGSRPAAQTARQEGSSQQRRHWRGWLSSASGGDAQKLISRHSVVTGASDGITRRRALLGAAVLGGASLAGVNFLDARSESSDQKFERADDAWSSVESGETTIGQGVVADVSLGVGQWAVRFVRPQIAVTLSYSLTVESGAPEVLVFDTSEFGRFRDGEEIDHYTDLHGTEPQPDASGKLDAGHYSLVVDNSAYGNLSPEGAVSGRFEWRTDLA